MKTLFTLITLLISLNSFSCQCESTDSVDPAYAGLELLKKYQGVDLSSSSIKRYIYQPTLMERFAVLMIGAETSCTGRTGDNEAVTAQCVAKRVGIVTVEMPSQCELTMKVKTNDKGFYKAAVVRSNCPGIRSDVFCPGGPRDSACRTTYSMTMQSEG